ncbi:MAG: FAD-binding protein, partial [Gemmatimonadota bacterium]
REGHGEAGERAGAVRLDMTGLAGVSEYDPAEFSFTARAGTAVREIEALLAENGQRMPFDPPFGERGATIGGTLAAGVNGPCRLRYGGLRCFVIGVSFVDGTGRIVRGGGKVVKNAAGFDLPRLMVGSMGRLGVITELTFKVFPAPRAWRTLRVSCRDLDDALAAIVALGTRPLELEALELDPPATLLIRVGGDPDSLDAHARRVGEATGRPYEMLVGDDDASPWRERRAFAWVPPEHRLIKVPLTPRDVPGLDRRVARQGVTRRYGVAGNVAWLAWPADRPLADLELAGHRGLVVRGPSPNGTSPWLGPPPDAARPFADRVKTALDPRRRLAELA